MKGRDRMKQQVSWLTRSAIIIALLVVIQLLTAGFGNTLITGSLVNLILIVAVMLAGPKVGLTAAFLSPIFAKIIGIGPLWPLVPFIAIGNSLFILVWYLLDRKAPSTWSTLIKEVVSAIVAAMVKSVFLYLTIVKFVVPVLLALPAAKANLISAMFSFPQFITGIIGGGLAVVILPILRKGIHSTK